MARPRTAAGMVRELRGFQRDFFERPAASAPPAWRDSFLKELDLALSDLNPQDLYSFSPDQLYSAAVPQEHRKALGQFLTPPPIARFMTEWVLSSSRRSLLDPAVGFGVFFCQMLALAPRPIPTLHAFDIDPVMVEGARRILGRLEAPAINFREEDFVLARIDERFDAIVGNPPYVRHHTLDYAPDVFDAIGSRLGLRLSRLTNIYGLFILRCFELLSDCGRYALITPSEFLNADFGVPLKEFLLRSGKLAALVLFDNTSLVFDGPLTTACITMVDKAKEATAPVRLVKVSRIEHLKEVSEILNNNDTTSFSQNGCVYQAVPSARLDPTRKWNPLFDIRRSRASKHLVPLGTFAESMRGIATGANNYFTLSEGELHGAGLGPSEVKSCLTKAAFAPFLDFTSEDFDALRRAGKKVYLINLKEPLSPAASQYVRLGEAQGIHRRYLTNARSLWFTAEQRPEAPILVTVFARGRFRFVLNRADVSNLTAYHCIYPRSLDDSQIRALMAYLSSLACARLLDQHKRVYGDGLVKLEPRDLLHLPVLNVSSLMSDRIGALAAAFDAVCKVCRLDGGWRATAAAKHLEGLVEEEVRG